MLNTILRVLSYIIGIGIIIGIWYMAPGALVWILDFNLWAIKLACGLLPADYGTMLEPALRLMLHADKALLWAEGAWLAGGMMYLIRRSFTR
ncbi:MAG: hypothetical protein EXS68_02145 [Candidatus Ryanbacteria bacterium]|nr:hypothetical protein [Candidatus Ryanbacteria bacterium]